MKRLAFVDGLRGIAAVSVVFYHLFQRHELNTVFHYGYLGVAIFFVISGFVIAMTMANHSITWGFAGRFALRRSIRLDPLYWVSMGLAIGLMVLAVHMGHPKELPPIGTVVAHLFYAQDLMGLQPISSVYWTLCLEIQFYLFLLVLNRLRAWIPDYFPVVICALVALSAAELTNATDISPQGLFLPYWSAFALGSMLYWVMSGEFEEFWLVFAFLLSCLFLGRDHSDWILTSVVTTIAIYIAWRFNKMDTWLSSRPMQFLGKISYSLYLMHPLIGWTAMSVALQHFDSSISVGVGLFASLASAYIAWKFIEQPSIKLSRRVKQ